MSPIDWRELYASNREVIERAGVPRPTAELPRTLGALPVAPRGRRRAAVHAPTGAERGAALPLVCMLHGCTQDAASFAAATRMNEAADRHGFVVVYPQQDRGDNPQGCWNWSDPSISGATRASRRRSSRASATSWRPSRPGRSIRSACSWPACPPAARWPRSWPPSTRTCSPRSRCTQASPTAPRSRCPPPSPRWRAAVRTPPHREAPARGYGELRPPCPEHGRPRQCGPHGRPVNAQQVLGQSMVADHLAAPGSARSTSIARRTSHTVRSAAVTRTRRRGGRTGKAPSCTSS